MTKPIIVQALQDIKKQNRNGKLVPLEVVMAASDPESPLHSKFQWDDSKAGHEYRLWQARQLITSITVVVDGPNEVQPMYFSLKSDRISGGYTPVRDILSSKRLHAEMIRTVLDELAGMKDRYSRFSELKPIWQAAKKVERLTAHTHPGKHEYERKDSSSPRNGSTNRTRATKKH